MTDDVQANMIQVNVLCAPPWIQNGAEPGRNDRIGKAFELGKRFFAVIWNAICALYRFVPTLPKPQLIAF